jgi:hypothetical protein
LDGHPIRPSGLKVKEVSAVFGAWTQLPLPTFRYEFRSHAKARLVTLK